ncbi:MAG: FAD-binding protein, partial [Chloroflexota bacterium]|nr:FAD-binding protein [Chloroflexota bacterium]
MTVWQKWVNETRETDVLVVGGGSAGCLAAIRAAEAGAKVLLVEKGHLGRSGCSTFAAGAINLCLPEDDQAAWMEEIVTRGEYLADQEWVRLQLAEAWPVAREVHGWGEKIGRTVLKLGQDGLPDRRRARGNIRTLTSVIYALPMMDALRAKVREAGVVVRERAMATHLLQDNGRVVGAIALGTRTGEICACRARAVILAGGGCSFKAYYVGNQNLTGEAQLMAYRAGATLRNLDQAMSNSTARAFDVHGLSHMVGSGGRFLNRLGEDFTTRYDPALGSRARLSKLVIGMAQEVEAGRGPIYLDLSPVSQADRELLQSVLPGGFRAFARMGVDPFTQPVEWMPAFQGTLAHGGGVDTDLRSATGIPGLYAVGDTTSLPVHGTWSITGLNLAFCLVSGQQAGRHAAAGAAAEAGGWPDIGDQVASAVHELSAPARRQDGLEPDQVTYALLEALIPSRAAYLR